MAEDRALSYCITAIVGMRLSYSTYLAEGDLHAAKIARQYQSDRIKKSTL